VSVGYPQTKSEVDSRAGQVALAVRATLSQDVKNFKAWLDTVSDAALQAAPYGYSATEASQLRSAYTDLDKLRTIYEGTATQATAYDFRTFAKLLTGVL
jgi:hypothetical protein